jgi:hypothetical protein
VNRRRALPAAPLARDLAVVAFAVGLAGGTARAESALRETAADLHELAAPAARTEVRLDLGVFAAYPAREDRAEVRVEIATRPDFWYGLGVSSLTRTTTELSVTTPGQSAVTTTTTSESFSLSARLYKRIGPLVLSAGLVDGRGGAGIELRSPRDRLRLEVLASEWRPSDPSAVPSVRVGASAQWHWLYVQGGILNVLDRAQTSGYLGLGMRWRDEDLLQAIWWLRRV